ncbi:unnamed protein product, partial [marine sediment metagenome]
PQNCIYYGCYHNRAFYRADGSKIADINNLPMKPAQADKVYDAAISGARAWIWDIAIDSAGNPVIVYSTIPKHNDPRYNTIKFGWMGWAFDSYGHTFLDSQFQDGAGYDVRIDGAGSSYYDFTVKWTLVLKACPCAVILIKDAGDNVVFKGTMEDDGETEIPLSEYLYTSFGNTYYTPHTVIVTNPGQEPVETVVTMDHRQSLEICQSDGEANLNGDCYKVDAADFAILSSHWHEANCDSQNDWCDGADMSGDGVVDYNDLRVLRGNWLNGTVLPIELTGNLNCDCVVDFA